jgi:hypothetical protein
VQMGANSREQAVGQVQEERWHAHVAGLVFELNITIPQSTFIPSAALAHAPTY